MYKSDLRSRDITLSWLRRRRGMAECTHRPDPRSRTGTAQKKAHAALAVTRATSDSPACDASGLGLPKCSARQQQAESWTESGRNPGRSSSLYAADGIWTVLVPSLSTTLQTQLGTAGTRSETSGVSRQPAEQRTPRVGAAIATAAEVMRMAPTAAAMGLLKGHCGVVDRCGAAVKAVGADAALARREHGTGRSLGAKRAHC